MMNIVTKLIDETKRGNLEWGWSMRHECYDTQDENGYWVSLYKKRLITYDNGVVVTDGFWKLRKLNNVVKRYAMT